MVFRGEVGGGYEHGVAGKTGMMLADEGSCLCEGVAAISP